MVPEVMTSVSPVSPASASGAVAITVALICLGWLVVTAALRISLRRADRPGSTAPDPVRAYPGNRLVDRVPDPVGAVNPRTVPALGRRGDAEHAA